MVCINPGDCTRSYCATTNTIITNSTDIQSIMAQYDRTSTITKSMTGRTITFTIKNIAPVPLENYTIIVNIPKTVATSATSLGASHPFTIIQEDPIIEFSLGTIHDIQEVTIDLPQQVDPALVHSIVITSTHNQLNNTPSVLTEELTITKNIIKDGNKTTLLLGLQPHAKLGGVRIPVQVPKCIATSAQQLQLSGDYEIIQDDPLIVWTFDTLTTKQTITIGLESDITEDCHDQPDKEVVAHREIIDTVDGCVRTTCVVRCLVAFGSRVS